MVTVPPPPRATSLTHTSLHRRPHGASSQPHRKHCVLRHTPPFCRPLPGAASCNSPFGEDPDDGAVARNRWGQFTPCFSTEISHFPADTVSKKATGLLPGESTHPPLVLAGALRGGPTRCLIEGGMRSSSGTEHHRGDLGPLHAGTKGALCVATWRKRTSNLNGCDRTITTRFAGICPCKRASSDSEGLGR